MDAEEDGQLFTRLYPGLRRWAAVVGPADVAPDDLVQEAVARVLRRGRLCDLVEPEIYLRRCIVNLASNERRGSTRLRRAWVRLGAEASSVTPHYPSDLGELQRLSPHERGALFLHDVEGRSFEEVARLLDCSPAAARKAASRGRQRLATLREATT